MNSGSLERRPAGKPRNRMEEGVRNDSAKLFNTKNWWTETRHRSVLRKKTGEAMARKRIEKP
jgi:hypothetical protein